MSDSEQYQEAVSESQWRKGKRSCLDTDDEDDTATTKGTKKAKKSTAVSTKRNKKPSTEKASKADGRSSSSSSRIADLFGDDEEVVRSSKALESVLWRRVAGGAVRRSADLNGDLFVEVRVYDKKDIAGVDARLRYWKAAVNLRTQLDTDAEDYELLSSFLKLVKKKFTQEGTFYPDRAH